MIKILKWEKTLFDIFTNGLEVNISIASKMLYVSLDNIIQIVDMNVTVVGNAMTLKILKWMNQI